MKPSPRSVLGATCSLLLAGGLTPLVPLVGAQTESVREDSEVLTRGPVHEAFAASISFKAEPGLIVTVAPPSAIDELPPDQRPVGDNVTWIPGYWAWDDDTDGYLWISGVWRNLPPGREWVPGYWDDLGSQRWQWVSGYWADSSTTEVSYLPSPPDSLEAGPNVEAPSDNDSWVPGTWMWVNARYAWRPGYWAPCRENWVWIPAHYRWTPRGYLFIDGYWDYAIPRRGVLFAPVHFRETVYSRPGFYYSPSTVISLAVFSSHLFVRPNYCHYYFGDYYAPRYRSGGYYASFSYGRDRRGFDPIYSYDRWRHRGDRDWERRRIEDFDYFRDHEDARPPRTWAALRELADRRDDDRDRRDPRRERNRGLADTLAQFVSREREGDDRGPRFQALDRQDRDQLANRSRQIRDFGRERSQWEKARKGDDGPDRKDDRGPIQRKMERSPIVSRGVDQLAKDEAPPERLEPREPRRPEGDPKRPGRDAKPGDRDNDGTPDRKIEPGPGGDRDRKGEPRRDDDRMPDRKGQPERDDVQPPGRKEPGPGSGDKPDRKTEVTPERRVPRGGDKEPGPGSGGERPERTMPERGDKEPHEPKRQPEKKAEPRPDPERQPERKVEPRPEPERQPERKVERPEPQRQPERKVERPEPQRQPERKAEPRPEPQRQPERKAEPRPEPQRQPERKAEPRPEPQRQPERKAEPQRQPERAAPQKGGGGGGGKESRGKGKDKDD